MINKHELLDEIEIIKKNTEDVLAELEIMKSTVDQSVMLRVIKHGGGYQYFQRRKGSETNGEYIRKKDINKAITLAQIEYDEKLLGTLLELKNALEECIANPFEKALEQIRPGKRELVQAHYISDEAYLKNWREQKYEILRFKENSPEYYTRSGIRVRSKSEVLIADMLDELSIPFLYEKPLQLKKKKVRPDFTLLNIKKRKEIYWEHFGMMDDREYRDDALMKIREYEASGFYQYDSVIWTFESSRTPVNTRDIRNMIKSLHRILGY